MEGSYIYKRHNAITSSDHYERVRFSSKETAFRFIMDYLIESFGVDLIPRPPISCTVKPEWHDIERVILPNSRIFTKE